MAIVNYNRLVDGSGISGKFGESMVATERWRIRVDDANTSKLLLIQAVPASAGVTWGSAHPDISALKAMEFDLAPEGREGMVWILTVKFYVPPKQPVNGKPADVWEMTGGPTQVPAFVDKDGNTITNAADDPLEGLTKERPERSWTLTKYYDTEALWNTARDTYDGKVNSDVWSNGAAKTWKCDFKGAKLRRVSKLDGSDDAGVLEFVETTWEFRYEPGTWKLMPWDVGFMEKVSGQRKTILGDDGKPVKQPVALNSNGTKKNVGQAPSVIKGGVGVDVYATAGFTAGFGTPFIKS